MRRPLAVTGFVFLSALAVALYFGSGCLVPIGCAAVLGLVVSLKSKILRLGRVFPLCFAVVLAAVSYLSVYQTVMTEPTAVLMGTKAQLTGAMCELPYEQYGRYYYTVLADSLTSSDGTSLTDTKLLISSSVELTADPYDIISGEVSINESVSARDLAKGIRLRGYFTSPEEVVVSPGNERPLYYYALKTRSYLSERIHTLMPEEQADFMSALLLGDKTGVSEETKTSLRRSGISHIIVVSGFHLSIIAQLIMLLLTFIFRGRKRPAAVLCIIILLFYMAVTGFSPSVTRAGIMQIAMLLAAALFKRADPLNALGLSVLIMTVCDPFSAGDVGLLLSYSATLGILLLSGRISSFLGNIIYPFIKKHTEVFRASFTICAKGIVSAFSASVSAFVFALPVVILYFREIAIYSVLTNLLVFAAIPLMIGSAFLMLVFDLSFVLSFLAVPSGYFSAVLAEYICSVSDFAAALPYAVINVSQSFVPLWLFLMIALAAVLYLMKKLRRRVSIFVFTLVLTFVFCSAVSALMNKEITRIAVLDTGEGLTVVAVRDSGALVFCCGGNKSMERKLTDYLNGTLTDEISLLLLTDNRYTTSNYAADILKDYRVGLLEVYDEESFKKDVRDCFDLAGSRLSHVSVQSPYNRVVIGDTVVGSLSDGENRAVLAELSGFRLLICTDRTDCEQLPEEWKQADCLVAGGRVFHTGEIDCKTVVVSGKETDKITRKAYEKRDDIYYTFSGGNIVIRVDKNNNTEIRREELWLS